MRFNNYFLLLTLLLVVNSSQSYGQKTFSINDNTSEETITSYLYITSPINSQLTLLSDTILEVNTKHSFEIYIKNNTDLLTTRIISFGEPHANVSSISILSLSYKDTIVKNYSSNKIEINLHKGETKRIQFTVNQLNSKDPSTISVVINTLKHYNNSIQKMYILQSFFLGLFMFLCIFNLILFFTTKWIVYLKYSIYIFFALLYFTYHDGFLQEVFPAARNISSNLVHIWYSLIFISYFYFINDFGNYKKHVPKAYYLLNIGIIYKLSQTFISTIFHFAGSQFIYSQTYLFITIFLETVLMIFIIFYILKNKNLVGRIVIIASLFLIVGGVLDQINLFENIRHPYIIEFAITLDLLAFSVGLGVVTKQFYQKKNINQQLYISQLKKTESFQNKFTKELEKKIELRTKELKKEKDFAEQKNQENVILLKEVHHRVKNNMQIVSSLLSLQERSITDPHIKEILLEGKERIESMVLVQKMLYQNSEFLSINMCDLLNKLTNNLFHNYGFTDDKIELSIHCSNIILDADTAIPVGLILNELIINTLKYAFIEVDNPTLKIYLLENNNEIILRVRDNGNGRVANLEKSTSFGMKLINSLTRQINGNLYIKEDKGLNIEVHFKLNYGN